MWLLFGVVALCVSLWWNWRRRVDTRWRGKPLSAGEFFDEGDSRKRSWRHWRLALPSQAAEFRLKPQGWLDTLFSRIGISNEVQTGDAVFDRLVYVESDLPEVRQALMANAPLRAAIVALLERMMQRKLKWRELRQADGRLWLRAAWSGDPLDMDAVDALGKRLREVARRLPQAGLTRTVRDRYFWRAAIVLTVSSALAISGAIAAFAITPGRFPGLLETSGLWALSAKVAPALIVLSALLVMGWLRRSARTHVVLAEVLTVGAFGIWIWTFCLLREANIRLDHTPARVVELAVEYRRHDVHRGRKRTRETWTVGFAGPVWPDRYDYVIDVSEHEYDRSPEGARWRFEAHPGALGFPWVGAGEPLPTTR